MEVIAMSRINIEALPDRARIWVFGCERQLSKPEVSLVQTEMDLFIEQWTAHKSDLNAGWTLKYGQFILVSVDEDATKASGCSIDSLNDRMRELERVLHADLLATSAKVFYRDSEDEIRCVERTFFYDLAEQESVGLDTTVFDNTVQTLGELRRGRWEVPVHSSWHKDVFGKVMAG
jgi:hypothetical protein